MRQLSYRTRPYLVWEQVCQCSSSGSTIPQLTVLVVETINPWLGGLGAPIAGGLIMKKTFKMEDLGVPKFMETPNIGGLLLLHYHWYCEVCGFARLLSSWLAMTNLSMYWVSMAPSINHPVWMKHCLFFVQQKR